MTVPVDLRIAAIADRQHGNITLTQLTALGLNRHQVAYRVKLGRLHRVHRGVYSVGRPPRTALERASAAVLACGPGATLSHLSALALWDLTRWPLSMAVTASKEHRHRGIILHRSTKLLPRDFRRHNGIRATSPARTLLDCAPNMSQKALARAVNEALRRKLVRRSDLADVVERFRVHPGAHRLAEFVETKGGPTRSGWEDDFPAFCRHFGLPEPVMAAKVAGWEVDALFPNEKVIVELDGWDFHSSRESFESDRERDASTLAAGHVTVRMTWERMHERAAREAARLQAILDQRRGLAA
jgi:Transcriptional regulator, AbiEi antitoxin